MLGRRRSAQVGATESLRAEMRAAHRELRSMVSDTVSTVEGAFRVAVESQERAASAVVVAVDRMRADLTARDADLGNALRRVVEACDALVERVHQDAVERTALVDAVIRLAVGNSTSIEAATTDRTNGDRIIGGKVLPNTEVSLDPEHVDPAPVDPAPVEPAPIDDGPLRARLHVQCRFGDRWVDGFEILEVVQSEGGLRCTVQRDADGYVLPTLFGPEDIRPSSSVDGRRPLVLHAPPRRVS